VDKPPRDRFWRRLKIFQWFWSKTWRRAFDVREQVLVTEEAMHLLLAALVGIVGGVVNVLFLYAIEGLKILTLRNPGDLVSIAEILSPWQRFLIPALGGLAAGLVLHWGLKWVNRGSTNFIEAVVAGDGRLRFGPGMVRGFSSLLSIASGASIGREGAIAALSATIASKLGQFAKWPPYRLRLLVGCGASAGIAAAYNAPIAGAVFAAQIVLGNFSMNIFAPLVTASVVATLVSRSFFGVQPWYTVPGFDFTHLSQLYWFLLLGIFAGVVGTMFLKMVEECKNLFARFKLPIYGNLMLGGLVVGAIAIGWPEVWGNGYTATNRILTHQMAVTVVLGLFFAKLIATVVAVGAGTIGGVFTPTLFLGAGGGCAFALVLHQAGYATELPTHTFALVGMGSVLAATVHSPLLAMIMMFEISLNYSMMPPLMLSCVLATLIARRLHPDSIYTSALMHRELESSMDSTTLGAAHHHKIGDVMQAPVPPVRDNALLPEIAGRFLRQTFNYLPVVDKNERLIGLVALHDLKPHLNAADELNSVIASDIMIPVPVMLVPGQLVLDALPSLLRSDQRNIPVINNLKERKMVGAVSKSEALGLLSEAIAANTRLRPMG